MKIIAYGSKYGTAKEYAEELSGRTGVEAVAYGDVGDINSYDEIIYFGPLYAGSVLGLKKTLSKVVNASEKKIIISTVGLADPNDEKNRQRIVERIKKQLPSDVFDNLKIHFLRGAIDYSRLSRKHRAMMAVAYRRAKGLDEEEMTAEIRAVVETYGRKVSFMDFDSLNPIVDEMMD